MTFPQMRWPGPCCAALLALGGGAFPDVAHAQPAQYALDPVHTRVVFAISHAGYSQAIGTVSGSTGTLVFDPDDPASARLEASVPMSRLDLGDAKWNQAALAANLLGGKDHPVATFVSTRVEPADAQHVAVFGILTLHGVAQEVKLDVAINKIRRYPLPPFRRTAGFSATTQISRKAFGITAWPTVIGDSVELRIEAEATRTRGDAGQQDDEADAPAAPDRAATDRNPPLTGEPTGGVFEHMESPPRPPPEEDTSEPTP